MSKILENKQLIHIAAEIIILVSLVYYFNQKHKKLLTIVEDLAQRIEEQEDLIQKHEKIIEKMVATINTLSTQQNPSQSYQSPSYQHKKSKSHELPKNNFRHSKPDLAPSVKRKQTPEQIFTPSLPKQRIEELYDDENEDDNNSDLDAELVEELNELDSDDLKKH